MTEQSDGFLGRWARRKSQARSGGATLPSEPQSTSPASPTSPAAPAGRLPAQPSARGLATPAPSGLVADLAASPGPAGQVEPSPPAPPPPTLQEAQQLTPASDFRPFVARAVAPEVRNAAFKQLFSDPHFNVMDGLDIYIDDYSKPDPLPLAVARELLAAHFPPAPAPTDSAAAAAPNAATGPRPAPAPAPVAQALAPSATPASAAAWPGPEDPATAQQPSDPAP